MTSIPFSQSSFHLNTLFILIILILCSNIVNATYTIHVAFKEESCFVIRTPKSYKATDPESFLISGTFEVLDEELSPDPISLVIFPDVSKAKTRELLYESEKDIRWDTFSAVVPNGGRFYLCVQHSLRKMIIYNKDKLMRNVGLDFLLTPIDKTSALVESAQRIQSIIYNVQSYTNYYREREATHRELIEQTFSQLLVRNVMVAVVVLLMGLIQIIMIRRLVEKRRSL
jgi:emp24/gp25L/p24 family/GOLD